MRPWDKEMAGRLDKTVLVSEALRNNPLGDPFERPLWVYEPPPLAGQDDAGLPTIYVLQGLTGQVDMWGNRPAMRQSLIELLDDHFQSGTGPRYLVVFVDAWTSIGGSQFLNSPGTGQYLDYLCSEVVPFVDANYPSLAGPWHRGVAGHSSGGYGAMVLPMLEPEVFSGMASHAGDAGFEYCYLGDLAIAARALRDVYRGSYPAFWADLRSRNNLSDTDACLLNAYCMAACYSAEPDGSVTLPFDPSSGRLRDEVWARWLEWDPLRMASRYTEQLRRLRACWIDCGRSDQYHMDVGTNAFHVQLEELGIEHHFELYEGNHSRQEHRYPEVWDYLARRLGPSA